MTRCPAHGNRIQLTPSRAVNLIGAITQPDCRWIPQGFTPLQGTQTRDASLLSGSQGVTTFLKVTVVARQ
jgi:hypothetical protein